MRDEDVIRHIEETIKSIHEESPPIRVKGVLGMIGLIAGTVVALGGAVTYGMNAWTSMGWVTRHEFSELVQSDGKLFEKRDDYLADKVAFDVRNDRQDEDIKIQRQTANEILAYVKIVPQLKTLIKIRCMGNSDVQGTIESLKSQYRDLTGSVYIEPRCDDPEMRGVR